MDLNNLSSNWKKLQSTLEPSTTEKLSVKPRAHHGVKRKRENSRHTAHKSPLEAPKPKNRQSGYRNMAQNGDAYGKKTSIREMEEATHAPKPKLSTSMAADKINVGLSSEVEIGKYVAVDCEMVGVGPNPDRESALARVSIVNYDGDQVYDSYVSPLEAVTDYRTQVSGITAKLLMSARPFKEVQTDVANIIQDRVIVGHSIRHDLAALMLGHPQRDIRDTSRHPPYRKIAGGSWPKLKILAAELLGTVIQEGEHSSVEDARACMMLFRKDKDAFEREHSKRWPALQSTNAPEPGDTESMSQRHKKKKKKRR